MARAFLRSFEAHSYSYVTKMIDKNAPSGRVRSSRHSAAQTPGCRCSMMKRMKHWTGLETRDVDDHECWIAYIAPEN